MAKKKQIEQIPKPVEDVRTDKPIFKDALTKILGKKIDPLSDKNKKQ